MTQRPIHRKGNLTKDRIQSLEVIGFIWCRQEHAWDEMYQRLVSYHQRVTFGAGLPELMVTFNHSSQKQTLDYLCIQPEEVRDLYLNEL